MSYHLNLTSTALEGAGLALLPGDPGRVPKLATRLDAQAEELAWKREFRSWRARVGGRTVLVCSTGIGGPSAAIACEELAQLGIHSFLRVGTTGAIARGVEVGSTVVPVAAVRREGTSGHFLPADVPAVADAGLVERLRRACGSEGVDVHLGPCCSSDTFYPGQERRDTHSGWVLPRFDGATEVLERVGVLNYEMECAAIFAYAMASGLRAAAILGVIVNRHDGEGVTSSGHHAGEDAAVRAACRAVVDGYELG
jgi:uridine phosphorylase